MECFERLETRASPSAESLLLGSWIVSKRLWDLTAFLLKNGARRKYFAFSFVLGSPDVLDNLREKSFFETQEEGWIKSFVRRKIVFRVKGWNSESNWNCLLASHFSNAGSFSQRNVQCENPSFAFYFTPESATCLMLVNSVRPGSWKKCSRFIRFQSSGVVERKEKS